MLYPNYGMYESGFTGADDRIAPLTSGIIALNEDTVPLSFPMASWQMQAGRYFNYWRWFNGHALNESIGLTNEGKPILKYPLGINPVRDFSRKHASVLIGQETFDTAKPLITTKIAPHNPITGEKTTQDDRDLALIAQNVVSEVWFQSNGRSVQMENATISQFLGGSVLQVKWDYSKKDEYQIPIFVKNIIPDFFLPVWGDDMYDLLEAFVVYRVPGYVAAAQYGIDNNKAAWVTYCEHWTKTHYSVMLDGVALTSSFSGKKITYDKLENPFGFVPFVYIPHIREGNFYGSSIVEDLQGLTKELNARTADTGDAIQSSVHRRRYVSDMRTNAKPTLLEEGTWAIDLGRSDPTTKESPKVWTEDPPSLSEGMTGFNDDLWRYLVRGGSMGDIAYGEDEGSQRSALTLAFRMWPLTSHANAERVFWTDGLNRVARMILKMCVVKAEYMPKGVVIPANYMVRLQLTQDWLPQIPRDREQAVNEAILRFQSGLVSPERALEMLGDVDYVQEEIARIQAWLKFQASLGAKPVDVQAGKGADTKMETPIATDGLGANE